MYRTNMEKPVRNEHLQQKIDTYGDMLFKLCMIRLQNVQDAEDVVQDVFYQYLRRNEAFESEEHEKAWLLKVAVNGCRKVWRSAWRKHRSDEEWLDKAETFGKAAEENSEPEEYSLVRERRQRLLMAVAELPAKYREVIHLFYYQELSVRAIAEITGQGQSTVTSQLTRGRELLRKSLKEEYDFE